jgi:hypothetical protein
MLKVIRKDLILNKNVMLINSLIFGACLIFFTTTGSDFPPALYAGFASMMVAFFPAVMVTREDKFNAMMLGCSLPVRRKTIVRARYLLSVGLAFAGIIGAFLLASFVPFSHFRPADLFAWGPFLTGMTGITIFLSFLLPFTLRFGMKGILIFLIATQVLGVLLLTLAKVTQSNADRRIVESVIGFFARAHETLGPTGFNLLLGTILVVLLGLSYLISVRAFENREI